MSKVKMRCARCHKTFTPPKGSRQVYCADCVAKDRAARSGAKTAVVQTPTAPMAAPKISGPGAGILDPRLAVAAVTAARSEVVGDARGADDGRGVDADRGPFPGRDRRESPFARTF